MRQIRSSPDYVFVSIVIILLVFGFVMLTSASSDLAKLRFGDSYYYLVHQLVYGLSFGAFGFFIGMFAYYRVWEKIAVFLLIINIILLLLVFTPLGVSVKGAERWVSIGGITFQPGELIKLSFLIYLSAWLSKGKARKLSFFKGLLPFLILIGSMSALLIMEPATTTAALLFGAAMLTYFTAGARVRFLVGSAVIAALALGTIIFITPYRLERVLSFINPSRDELGASYHINQSQTAIGSGGIAGAGYGKSTTKLNLLPEPLGDSIFAVIAEELGFVGGIALIAAFLAFVWRGFDIAKHARDGFGRLLATSFISLIGLQVFVNIAAISGLIPLTGVPLPFVSYGGTALAVFLTMSGIIVNISRYR